MVLRTLVLYRTNIVCMTYIHYTYTCTFADVALQLLEPIREEKHSSLITCPPFRCRLQVCRIQIRCDRHNTTQRTKANEALTQHNEHNVIKRNMWKIWR